MRVAYVCTDPGVPVFGRKGASVHVQAVLGALTARGDQLQVIAARVGDDRPAHLPAMPVHVLPVATAESARAREHALRRADDHVVDVLDHLAHQGGVDLVYERYALWGRSATAWAAERGVPSVVEVNAPLVEEQSQHRVLVDRTAAERVAHEVLSRAGTVVCVSERVAAWARAHSTNPERVHVVGNGVDTHRVRPAAEPPDETPFTIGFVGSLKPWHGVEDLVSAVALLAAGDDGYRLLVVGDGPQREAIRSQVRALSLDDVVEMTGAVPPDEIPTLLHRMHVAVAPYPSIPDFYFSPLKVYEYLAAGLPVVASDVGDLATVLDGGRLGVLTEAGEPAALARAIASLRADPGRRDLMGRAGRRRAIEHHDWAQVVETALAHAAVGAPTSPREEPFELGGHDAAAS